MDKRLLLTGTPINIILTLLVQYKPILNIIQNKIKFFDIWPTKW